VKEILKARDRNRDGKGENNASVAAEAVET